MLKNKDITFFQKNGYLIKKSKEINSINYLQNKVFDLISKKNKNINKINKSKKTVFFQKLHKHINKKKLNEIRLSIVNGINSDDNFYKSYYKSASEMLDGLVGNEIAMQKKLIFQFRSQMMKNQCFPCTQTFMQAKVLLRL